MADLAAGLLATMKRYYLAWFFQCEATLTVTITRRGACALVLAGSIWIAALPSWAGGDETCGKIAESIAIDALREKVKAEHLYEPWAKEQCLWFYPEHCDSEKVDVAIRELHSEQCGGDPATGPVVDRFRVHRKSGKIEWYNVENDKYLEVSKNRCPGRWCRAASSRPRPVDGSPVVQ